MSAALLQVRALEKIFGGFAAVAGVDLTVAESTIHSVIGPNGAGKTTFFRLLTGVQRPHRGSVVFAGADITGSRPHAIARAGLVQSFQITNVFPRLTVLESIQTAILARQRHSGQLLTFRHRRVAREARELLGQVGLAAAADSQARTLSHGDQRVLEVSLALATDPRLLLLDEPTAGMSPWETERMVRLVVDLARERGLTVLLSEHDMEVVFGISETVTVLHQGRVIAEGSPAQVRRNADVVAIYLGSEVS